MKLGLIRNSTLLLALVACGPDPRVPPVEVAPQATRVEEGFVAIEERAPDVPGGEWKRRFQLSNPESALWTVEKKIGAGEWKAIGFTDEAGAFVDDGVAEPATYRFGSLYESQVLPGLTDLVLAGESCAKAPIVATRIFIIEGSTITLGACPHALVARSVVIDGTVRAFPPEATGDGGHAPQLTIEANELSGRGRIVLRGMPGRTGEPGRNGAPGTNGTIRKRKQEIGAPNGGPGEAGGPGGKGGDGGNGGALLIRARSVTFSPANIDLSGELGGAGGRAGAGGPGGKAGSWEEWIPPTRGSKEADFAAGGTWITRPGAAGAAGASGADGPPGAPGVAGKILQSSGG